MSNSREKTSEQGQTIHKGIIIEELHQAGLEMKLCQLKREHPDLSSKAIEDLFYQWLYQPPSDTEGWTILTIIDPKLKQEKPSK